MLGLAGGRSGGSTITSAFIASKLLLPAAIFFGPATPVYTRAAYLSWSSKVHVDICHQPSILAGVWFHWLIEVLASLAARLRSHMYCMNLELVALVWLV